MGIRAALRIGWIALVCFACTGQQAGGSSGTEVAGPCGQSPGGPIGLDEPLPLSVGAGGRSSMGGDTARAALQSALAKASRSFKVRLYESGCDYIDTPLTISFSADPSNLVLSPAELSCAKSLEMDGISMHLKTADGALDEVVPGVLDGNFVRQGSVFIYAPKFSGSLGPALHGSYDLSRVKRLIAEPQLELQYDLEFGYGELIAKDASNGNNKTVIARLDSSGPYSPSPPCGCAQGGGPAVHENYTAGTTGCGVF